MDRLISEQAVIDAIDKWIKNMGVLTVLPANKVTPLFESIHELSPVKQEPCDKCVYSTEDGYCQYDDITETIPPFKSCDDVISRQVVLATISELNAISFYEAQEDSKECYYEIKNAIKQVPPANPQEPKTGHWIIYDVHGHKACKCSECDKDAGYPCNDKYCPNCGHFMIKPQERSDTE